MFTTHTRFATDQTLEHLNYMAHMCDFFVTHEFNISLNKNSDQQHERHILKQYNHDVNLKKGLINLSYLYIITFHFL